MANYEIDPKILPFLPKGVELDLYNGKAYMSLGGLCLRKLRFNVPILWFYFEEINLRFYVVRKEGNTLKRGGFYK
jgi:uncharacterized protein YqjF (DUF2071 family)